MLYTIQAAVLFLTDLALEWMGGVQEQRHLLDLQGGIGGLSKEDMGC